MYHTKLSILDCPIEFDQDPTGRKQLVAALLRFADELDIDSRRVNIHTVLAFSLDPQNSVHWWFHENIRVFLENGRVTIRTLLHPDDFKEYEPLAYDNSIGRFQRKNKLVMDVLNWYRHPAWISYMSKVVEAPYSPKLPVEITEVLDEMKAPRKPREEREATNLLKNADRLVKDLRELDNRWHAIMLELHSFDSSWPLERRCYVSSRLTDFTGQEVILPTVRKTVAALESQSETLEELGLSNLADQSKELLKYAKKILRAIDRSRGTPVPKFDDLQKLLENIRTACTPEEVEFVKQQAQNLLDVFDRRTLGKMDKVFGKLEDHVTRIYPSISKPETLKSE
jgi:hypothetical protein